MPKLVPVVEGDGEVEAVPVLLRRLLEEEYQVYDWQVIRPKNAHGCGNLSQPNGIERFVEFALLEPECDGVLVLIDGDAVHSLSAAERPADDCSPALAKLLARRVQAIRPRKPVVVVVARWEYEAWFLASVETIAGKEIKGLPGLTIGSRYEGDVESLPSPKGWIEARFPPGRKYSETRDQAPMTRMLDFDMAEARSRSFRRLKNALKQILDAYTEGQIVITPLIASLEG